MASGEVKPVRLQLSRRKGFDLQALSMATNGLPAVNVARPSKWGNPYKVGDPDPEHPDAGDDFKGGPPMTAEDCVENYRYAMRFAIVFPNALADLRGKNLACWCAGPHCHADVLLALSNTDTSHGD